MSDFSELIQRAKAVRHLYTEYETKNYGRNWSRQEIALGFFGDVGDLAKLILAKEGVRNIENMDEKLAHELADCLWSVIILADLYDVDLESAFVQTMNQLEESIQSKM